MSNQSQIFTGMNRAGSKTTRHSKQICPRKSHLLRSFGISLFSVCLLTSLPSLASVSSAATSDEEKPDIYISDNKLDRVSVKWVAPKKFTDVKEANFSSSKYRKHVFTQLEKHLDKLASELPEGQSISFEVTNVDLAGRIEPARMLSLGMGMNDIRVMRDIDIPRIRFSYTVVDADGNVLKTEDVNLKDMNYLNSTNHIRRDRAFFYEKDMLSKWFKKEVLSSNS